MSLDDDSHIESKPMDHVTGFYRFLKDHPLYHTHHVSIVSDSNRWVPNFIGGASTDSVIIYDNTVSPDMYKCPITSSQRISADSNNNCNEYV